MSALTIYNLEKQGCLYDVLGIKYLLISHANKFTNKETESTVKGRDSVMWTAAKENSCGNKYEWCSKKLFFHVSPELIWKQQQNISADDKCVTFESDRDAQDGRLGLSNCQIRQRIVCEVPYSKV